MTVITDPVDLIPKNERDGEVDAVLPVRWCVPKASVEELKAHDAEDVHVLIIARQGAREIRWLHPIDRGMAYVQFDRPGEWKLDATLVWNRAITRKLLRSLLVSTRAGSYDIP